MAGSLKEIAERVGVSPVAVSLALRGNARVSEERRRQIQAIADELGYRPNPLARAMRTRKSHTVGLLLADLRTSASNLKIEAIEQQVRRHNHQLLLGFTGASADQMLDYVENMIARQVDGLIIFGRHATERLSGALWRRLRERLGERLGEPSLPIVLADVQTDTRGSFVQVGIDRAAAMGQAVDHLAGLGHRSLMYVGPAGGSSPEKLRGLSMAAARREINASGLRYESIEIPREDDLVSDVSAIAEQIAARKVRDRPTAVIASSDFVAMTLIGQLAEHGIATPRDVSVIGFDGDEIARRVFRPRLTTLVQPQELLAERVVAALLQSMDGKDVATRSEHLCPTLTIGESTAKAPVRR